MYTNKARAQNVKQWRRAADGAEEDRVRATLVLRCERCGLTIRQSPWTTLVHACRHMPAAGAGTGGVMDEERASWPSYVCEVEDCPSAGAYQLLVESDIDRIDAEVVCAEHFAQAAGMHILVPGEIAVSRERLEWALGAAFDDAHGGVPRDVVVAQLMQRLTAPQEKQG